MPASSEQNNVNFVIFINRKCIKAIYSVKTNKQTQNKLTLGLIGWDGGLSTLCHICGFVCQERMLKTFPDPGFLCSKDGVV